MSADQPAWLTKWLGKHVEWSDSGVWRKGTVLDVERFIWDHKPKLRLRILGANGFVYPGVDEALVNEDR